MVDVGISNSLYEKLPNLVLGFHGCDVNTYENVIKRQEHLKRSENDYDWIGNGIYFWENSYERALEWANNKFGNDSRVVGAVIDLGRCLNLTDIRSTGILQNAFSILSTMYSIKGMKLPENKKGRSKVDLLLRNRDCAVIQMIHALSNDPERFWEPYDSVRGVFVEGGPVYEGAGIPEKTHIQLCIVNPNCIKGYFSPINPDTDYPIP